MFRCPNCKSQLRRVEDTGSAHWSCNQCGGRAVRISQLRETAAGSQITDLWALAVQGEGELQRPCPVCEKLMLTVPIETEGGTQPLDVCKSCQLVWSGAKEYAQITSEQLPSRKSRLLPDANATPKALHPAARSAPPKLPSEWKTRKTIRQRDIDLNASGDRVGLLIAAGITIHLFVLAQIISGVFESTLGMWIMMVASAVWAIWDSARINAMPSARYADSGFAVEAPFSPIRWGFGIILFWIIAFPWYLSRRYKIKNHLAKVEASELEGSETANRVDMRHSGLGIASFGISIVTASAIIVLRLVATTMQVADPESPEAAVVGLLLIGTIPLSLVAAALGILGLAQENRKKVTALLGMIFNSVMMLIPILAFIAGATQRQRPVVRLAPGYRAIAPRVAANASRVADGLQTQHDVGQHFHPSR